MAPSSGAVPIDQVALRLHPEDHVAIAKVDLPAGVILEGAPPPAAHMVVRQPIPAGHKVSLVPVGTGDPVRRYGQVIGLARQPILPGDHVHVHNLHLRDLHRSPHVGLDARPVSHVPEAERRTFLGYRRADGRIGTRNYVAIISTVNCSAHVTREIARHFTPERLADHPNVDGVIALTHPWGCPVDQPLLQRTLAGMARHPNVGACLFVGLGCETNQAADLVDRHDLAGPVLVIQELGGTRRTIQAGIERVEALLPSVNALGRTTEPISKLVLALQCGGSDSWSGVTANPAVGLVADELVRQGGTVVLAETPEVYGAEHLLTRRATSPEVGEKLLDRVRWWGAYAQHMGLRLDDNRSAGNQRGGLTTIYEKSLGAIAKAGNTPLVDVYDYAEPVTSRGFVFMDSPGYDPVSVTGQVAGGCTLVLFTTGRGSVFGFRPAPTIKISTHTRLYERMAEDMDLDAGVVLDGTPLGEVAAQIQDRVVAVASGQPSKSEAQGVGEAEFVPWDPGGTV
jgi:altronate dehydratase